MNKPVHYEALYAVLAGTPARRLAPGGLPRKFDLRVLVVEDHPVNRRLAERVLQNLGCTPALVTDGQEALRLLTERAEAFDVILLDLHMPEMDGLSLLAALRAGKAGARAQGLWVIALTADARDEQRREALAAGLNDYLTKPLQPGALEAALQRYQEERSRPRG